MLTLELLNVIDQYLKRVIGLEELEDWLAPRLPFFFRWPYSSTTELVAEIEMALADMSEQRQTEEDFRSLLNKIVGQPRAVWINYPTESIIYTESSNQSSPTVIYVIPEFAYALV